MTLSPRIVPVSRSFGGRAARALVALAVAALAPASAWGAGSGTGATSAVVGGFVEVNVTDATIAAFIVSPTSSDPGPRAFSTSDSFAANNGFTNARGLLSLDITSATNAAASSTVQVQGTTHTIANWIYTRQDSGSSFATYETAGTFDSSAASYTAPGGFTKSSQGTFTVRYYSTAGTPDGGSTQTVNWIYDAGANKYMFDTADKDFSNGNGEATVWPVSKLDQASLYTYTVQGAAFGVTSVASSGSNYVPTVNQAWQLDFLGSGSSSKTATVLIDFPGGAPKDTYSYTTTLSISLLQS